MSNLRRRAGWLAACVCLLGLGGCVGTVVAAVRANNVHKAMNDGDVRGALETTETMANEARRFGQPETKVMALQLRGLALAMADRTEEAEAAASEIPSAPGGKISQMNVRAAVAIARCKFGEAYDLEMKIREERKDDRNDSAIESNLAEIDAAAGRLESAIARYRHVLELGAPPFYSSSNADAFLQRVRVTLAVALLRAGKDAEAKAFLPLIAEEEIHAAALKTADYALAENRAHRRAVWALTSAILIADAAGLPREAIAPLRERMKQVLDAYAKKPSPCREALPDPLALETAKNRLVLAPRSPAPVSSPAVAMPAAAPSAAPAAAQSAQPAVADRDGDGLPDSQDKCPDQAEVVNDIEDGDGCPDEAPGKLVGTQVQLRESIQFAHDSDKIEASANPVLDWLATFLKQHKEIEAIAIEGHTDDVGDASHNLGLSRRRAASVVQALVSRGVAQSRLSSEGFGMTRPLLLGKTDAARAVNRRVELFARLAGPLAAAPSASKPATAPPAAAPSATAAPASSSAAATPAAPQGASLADFADTTKADALFARLKDKPIADFAPVLTLLGFSVSEIDLARNGTLGLGWHRPANLDSDPALEHVVHLQAVVDPQGGDASQGVTYEHYVAVLDQGAQGLSVLGRHRTGIRTCIAGQPLEVKLEPIHAAEYSDILMNWVDAPGCNGNYEGTIASAVMTLARGKLETLFEYSDRFETGRTDGRTIDPMIELKLEGAPPKTILLVGDKDKVTRRHTFDAAKFSYR